MEALRHRLALASSSTPTDRRGREGEREAGSLMSTEKAKSLSFTTK